MTRTTIALLASVAMGAIAVQQAAPTPLEDIAPPSAERDYLYRAPDSKPPPQKKGWLDIPSWVEKLGPNGIDHKKALRQILPPVEYEKPYLGKLTITRLATEKEISAVCPKTKYPYKLGCAQHSGPKPDGSYTVCRIIIVFDSVIAKANLSFNDVFRHELAHCNGWGGDHWGARMAPEPVAAQRAPAQAPTDARQLDWKELPESVQRGLGLVP